MQYLKKSLTVLISLLIIILYFSCFDNSSDENDNDDNIINNSNPGICYIDKSCSTSIREISSNNCVSQSTCSQLWKCKNGPTSGCGGGSQDCLVSPGCGDGIQKCYDGYCTSISTCNDRIKYEGYSSSPSLNECNCNNTNTFIYNERCAGSGICYIDKSCSTAIRDIGNNECVSQSTCTQLWKCKDGPTSGCGGGSQDCLVSPGCGDGIQKCYDGYCTSISTCNDRIKFEGYSSSPSLNECNCNNTNTFIYNERCATK